MYYVKVRVKFKNSGMVNTVVLHTKNQLAEDAAKHAVAITQGWEDVSTAEVIEVAPREIKLQKFLVVVKLYFNRKPPRETKIHVTEENEELAALLADEIVQEWKDWKEYEIVNLIPLITKRY